jgi:hypothetical protein
MPLSFLALAPAPLRKEEVRTFSLQHLPAFDQCQPERPVGGIARRRGKAAAFVGAALEFVVTLGPHDPDGEILDGGVIDDGGLFDGVVEHRRWLLPIQSRLLDVAF